MISTSVCSQVLFLTTQDACGGWEKRVEIPSDRGRYGTIDEVSESNDRILRDIFSGSYPGAPPANGLPDPTDAVDVQNFLKLQDAYNACLNETIIDGLGARPLVAILQNVIAKYPVDSTCHPIKFQGPKDKLDPQVSPADEHCSETKDSLTDVMGYLQSIGAGALFSLVVTVASRFRFTNEPRKILRIRALISCLCTKTAQVFPAKIIIRRLIHFAIMRRLYTNLLRLFSASKTLKNSSYMLPEL
jgi:Peptidase family M13